MIQKLVIYTTHQEGGKMPELHHQESPDVETGANSTQGNVKRHCHHGLSCGCSQVSHIMYLIYLMVGDTINFKSRRSSRSICCWCNI